MTLGLPNINIEFKAKAGTAIQRGERGVVAIILKDTKKLIHTIYDITDVPKGITVENKEAIEMALIGNTQAPKRVELIILAADEELAVALDYFDAIDFDYLVYPEVTQEEGTTISTWIKAMRDNEGKMVKAVLPNVAGNHEGIINFTSSDIVVGDKTYTAAMFCPRIAGFIAGTDLKISTTYGVLSEVIDIPNKTKKELNEAILAGELILFKQKGKVKIARGVTSFTEPNEAKGVEYQKIKIVDTLDLIKGDIQNTAHESYIGKYGNSYDNKCLLSTAIAGYFEGLELDGLIEKGSSSCTIDIDAQKNYLKSIGLDINSMTDDEIKTANTGDKVFLVGKIKPLDAIEEINLKVII